MKIVIVQGAFLPAPPIMGGAIEKLWIQMAREFVRAGHSVLYLSRRHPKLPNEEWIDGVQHVRVPGFNTPRSVVVLKAMDLIYSLRIPKLLPRDADAIVTNTFWLPILLRGARARKVYVDVGRAPKGQMKFYRHVGRLRGNSTPIADAIKRELDGEEALVSMIPNPLPFEPVNTDSVFAKKEKRILYTGRVHPEKGLHLFLEALRQLPVALLDGWRIDIVGPWEVSHGGGGRAYLDTLESLAKGMPVQFAGPIFDVDQLNDFYRAASIFCYPSLADQGETFGLAPLEAMAWGCVPVVSSIACFRDFIAHDRNGLVFDHHAPKAASELRGQVEKLIVDVPLRNRLAAEAILVNRSHAPALIAERFLEDFKNL
ncbi:MAG TPA: glycosyltransferase family 4 protein [Chthoniobacterales bacterium]